MKLLIILLITVFAFGQINEDTFFKGNYVIIEINEYSTTEEKYYCTFEYKGKNYSSAKKFNSPAEILNYMYQKGWEVKDALGHNEYLLNRREGYKDEKEKEKDYQNRKELAKSWIEEKLKEGNMTKIKIFTEAEKIFKISKDDIAEIFNSLEGK